MLFDFSYLIFNVLFKRRDDLFEATQLLLYRAVSICNVLDNDALDFLRFRPLIVELRFDVLLPTKHGRLNVVHHFLQLLVLVR